MTEDEAKTKACCGPFAGRLPYGDKNMSEEIAIQGLDPDYAVEIAARWPCIGSACMAWRTTSADGAMEERITVLRPKGRGWQEIGRHVGGRAVWLRKTPATPTGFCGLAGAAQ